MKYAQPEPQCCQWVFARLKSLGVPVLTITVTVTGVT
jgi:hypothetical protein